MNDDVKPRVRPQDLLLKDLGDETVVIDLANDRAHCLNGTTVLVWRACDGESTVAQISAAVARQLGAAKLDDAVVWMALDQLSRARLLSEPVVPPADAITFARRHALRKIVLAGGLSIVLPALWSIVSPTPAYAASCRAAPAPLGSGNPCCSPGASTGSCCEVGTSMGSCAADVNNPMCPSGFVCNMLVLGSCPPGGC